VAVVVVSSVLKKRRLAKAVASRVNPQEQAK
jgi:hypothetical protein